MAKSRFFGAEQIRMTLSLACLIASAPIVIPSGSKPGALLFFGWALFAISLILPLWSRFTSISRKRG